MKLNRKLRVIIAGVTAIAAVGSGIGYHVAAAGNTEDKNEDKEWGVKQGTLELTFEEEGVTQISTTAQKPEFKVNVVTMTVEEVYAESGDTVAEGDALFKLTEESVANAAAYYEKAVADAQRALESAKLDYESGVLEAESDLQEERVNAEAAEENYEAAEGSLEAGVEEKKEAYEEAVETIKTYQENLDNGTYYTKAGINEKQDAVNAAGAVLSEAQNALVSAQESYEAAKTAVSLELEELNTQIINQVSYEELASLQSRLQTDYAAMETASQGLASAQAAAEQAKSAGEKAKMTFDSAVSEYEKDTETANTKITELTERLDELQAAYEQAEREAVTEKEKIKNEYEEATLEGQYADAVYQSATAKLQSAVDSAQETLEDLWEEQEALLKVQTAGGVIGAAQAGTVASVAYEAEDILAADTAVASYYDTGSILISVEVLQDKVAKLQVGDETEVTVSGRGNKTVQGTIASIASAATSGGASKVTYEVTVAVDNSEGTLSAGVSAEVSFCYGELENVLYIETEAVEKRSDGSGTVLQYDENNTAVEVPVTLGDSTNVYTVITEGVTEGDVCLGKQEEAAK